LSGRIHVVGGGLAGLAAAVELAAAGRPVTLYEQAGQAGGRCRSFFDETLQRTIDNGNHLVLSGNTSLMRFLRRIGAEDRLSGPEQAAYPFIDLQTGERWTVRLGAGALPLWLLSARRRIPGSRLREYATAIRLATAGPDRTVADCLDDGGALYHRFWEPLAISVLNTHPREGAARLLWPVLKETFGRGERACRPRLATRGLANSFVDPALAFLRKHQADIRLKARLSAIDDDGRLVRSLLFATGGEASVTVAENDAVILAVPPSAAAGLRPELVVPKDSRAIVNAHFRLARPVPAPGLVGLIGGSAQWIFTRDDVASVTISAADGLARERNEAIASRLWPEVRHALQLSDSRLPPWRVIKEKRATFAQTPAQARLRPGCHTILKNLFLAGDWIDTGLPATIEGSVRSGHTAASCLFAVATRA
jgi:squalene-associated FAD-dependent desaturase